MLIEEKALKHWMDNFYGYGSWHARLWFIAHDEGGGDMPEEVADKINYFYKAHPQPDSALCNIRELYRHVAVRWNGPKANSFDSLFEYRFGNNAIQHGVWKNLIAFIRGFRNENLPDALSYQQHTFASASNHNEALIRLYPLPSAHTHAWYYSWLDLPRLGFLKSRAEYQEAVYQRRIHNIFTNVAKHKPQLVLMYGMENINRLKASIQELFPGARFKMVKAMKRQIPQHHRVDLDGTTLLITTQIPALRHNRIETGFDWEEFGKSAKARM